MCGTANGSGGVDARDIGMIHKVWKQLCVSEGNAMVVTR